jgi:hypothetical protein
LAAKRTFAYGLGSLDRLIEEVVSLDTVTGGVAVLVSMTAPDKPVEEIAAFVDGRGIGEGVELVDILAPDTGLEELAVLTGGTRVEEIVAFVDAPGIEEVVA